MRAPQLDLLDLELPVVLRPATRVSDDELMRFSRGNRPYKIERTTQGDLKIMTPVGGIGSTHERYVTRMLGNWTAENGTGIDFSPNGGFNLPDGSCLSPDAAWLSMGRWNRLTLKQQTGFPPLCPEFVLEIRSVSDSRRGLEAKMQTWLDNGAQLAWLVDPIDANVVIYRPNEAPEALDRPAIVAATAPLVGFALDCTPLWPAR